MTTMKNTNSSNSPTTLRGIRNNNPGNVRAEKGVTWVGQTGVDPGGFVVFDTPIHGIRCMARVLRDYGHYHHLDTIRGIITRWAPPDTNDTDAYIADVAEYSGLEKDEPINGALDKAAIVEAIIHHENGGQPYKVAEILAGIHLAGW